MICKLILIEELTIYEQIFGQPEEEDYDYEYGRK